MSIPCPAPRWPAVLLAIGPAQDPAILLRGIVDFTGARYAVIAVRIEPIRMEADFRAELPPDAYAECEVENIFDDLLQYAELTQRALVHLATGAYAMMMIPADQD